MGGDGGELVAGGGYGGALHAGGCSNEEDLGIWV